MLFRSPEYFEAVKAAKAGKLGEVNYRLLDAIPTKDQSLHQRGIKPSWRRNQSTELLNDVLNTTTGQKTFGELEGEGYWNNVEMQENKSGFQRIKEFALRNLNRVFRHQGHTPNFADVSIPSEVDRLENFLINEKYRLDLAEKEGDLEKLRDRKSVV